MKKIILIISAVLFFATGFSQQDSSVTVHGGLRFQKYAGFYFLSGISGEIACQKILKKKISMGFSFVTSRLGSALGTNAIPCSETEIYAVKYFRQAKAFRPYVRLNAGLAHASYGSDRFDVIQANAFLLSIEPGLSYDFKFPLKLTGSFGYNVFTGNGSKGLGTVFPVYFQLGAFWKLSK